MHCKLLISGSEPRFNLSSPTKISPFQSQPFSHDHLSRNTHLRKLSSGSHRFRPKAAVTALSPVTESFYDLLGIPESGTMSEIKSAYKQLALKYHPDVSPPDRAVEYTEKFIRVQEAYETSSDARKRSEYDTDRDFTGRKGVGFGCGSEEKGWWKDRWQSQIMELKKRNVGSNCKVEPTGGMSWGSRIGQSWSEAHGWAE